MRRLSSASAPCAARRDQRLRADQHTQSDHGSTSSSTLSAAPSISLQLADGRRPPPGSRPSRRRCCRVPLIIDARPGRRGGAIDRPWAVGVHHPATSCVPMRGAGRAGMAWMSSHHKTNRDHVEDEHENNYTTMMDNLRRSPRPARPRPRGTTSFSAASSPASADQLDPWPARCSASSPARAAGGQFLVYPLLSITDAQRARRRHSVSPVRPPAPAADQLRSVATRQWFATWSRRASVDRRVEELQVATAPWAT